MVNCIKLQENTVGKTSKIIAMGIDDVIVGKTQFDGMLRNTSGQSPCDLRISRAFIKVNNENHAPSILVDDDETVFIVWFAGSTMGNGDVSIYLSQLLHQKLEKTSYEEPHHNIFTAPKVISKIDGYSCQNPIIFKDKGKLIIYHTAQPAKKSSFPYSQEDALIFRIESTDKGDSWSNPTLVFGQSGLFIRGKPVRADDRLLLPVYTTPWNVLEHHSVIYEIESNDSKPRIIHDFYDQGLVQGSLIKVDNEYQLYFRDRRSESIYGSSADLTCHTSDKSLCDLTCHTSDKSLCDLTCHTSDQSLCDLSWSSPKRTVLPNNNSGIAFEYLGDSYIAAVINPTTDARYPLSLFISPDKGKTWKFRMNMHDDVMSNFDMSKLIFEGYSGPEMSYPAMMVNEGKLHIVYSYCRGGICYMNLDLSKLLLGLLRNPSGTDQVDLHKVKILPSTATTST